MGSLFEHLLSADESGGLGVSLVTQPPGIATPLHRHTHEDEAFFLLDGTMTYRAGDEVFQLAAGDFIWLPRGLPHAFRVTGTSPVRFVGFADPAGSSDSTTRSASRPASAGFPAPTGTPWRSRSPAGTRSDRATVWRWWAPHCPRRGDVTEPTSPQGADVHVPPPLVYAAPLAAAWAVDRLLPWRMPG